jgi:hypothetical protein
MSKETCPTGYTDITKSVRNCGNDVSFFFISLIKSREMKWVVHVARRGQKRNAYRVPVRKSGGRFA